MKGFVLFASLIVFGMAEMASAQLFGLRSVDPVAGRPGQVVSVNENTGKATFMSAIDTPLNWLLTGDIAFRGQDAYITDAWTGGPGLNFGKIDVTTGHFTSLNNQGGDLNWFGLAYVPTTDLFYTVDIVENRFRSITPDGATITDIAFNDWTPTGLAYVDSEDKIYATNGFDIITIDYHNGAIGIIGQLNPMVQGDEGELAYNPFTDTLYANVKGSFYTVNRTNAHTTFIGTNQLTSVMGLGYRAVPEPASLAAMGVGVLALLRRRRRRA